MNKLEQTWRWYGPEDPVTLQDIKQAGASGIVTALHHIPHGEIWSKEEILKRKQIVEDAGLRWSVVESVTVHEAIKTGKGEREKYLQFYNQTLQNLADCGITMICYNFMPVLDWTRTELFHVLKNGAKALYFNWVDLALFDIYLLKRNHATLDYTTKTVQQAKEKFEASSSEDLKILEENILMGIPGEKNTTLESLSQSISIYQKVGFEGLRANLKYFLEAISETCVTNDIKMTLHPDDPPYSILGLPRIASDLEDFETILKMVDQPFNGICFCSGSLGAGRGNDVVKMFSELKDRVNFIHLRNVKKDEDGNFYEADHLDGDVDMKALMKLVIQENQKRKNPIPFRPDHGHQILDDLNKKTNPGYSAIGRLKGLAELRGLELGLLN